MLLLLAVASTPSQAQPLHDAARAGGMPPLPKSAKSPAKKTKKAKEAKRAALEHALETPPEYLPPESRLWRSVGDESAKAEEDEKSDGGVDEEQEDDDEVEEEEDDEEDQNSCEDADEEEEAEDGESRGTKRQRSKRDEVEIRVLSK